jgi:hypothetical protein
MNVEVVPEAMKWCEQAQQGEEEQKEEEVKDIDQQTKDTLLQLSSSITIPLIYI